MPSIMMLTSRIYMPSPGEVQAGDRGGWGGLGKGGLGILVGAGVGIGVGAGVGA